MTAHAPVSPASGRRMTGASVGIPPRQLEFRQPADQARHAFFNGNALASSLFVVMSGIFPPGERFFMESVRHFREGINDPKLRAEISGFMGQEALHGREHERLNAFFAERGIDVAMPERMIRISLGLLEKLPARQQLACTTFMEHFTALLAEQWLTDDRFQQTSDPEMLKLWYWHALEELEHKAVAYDVLDQVHGTHAERLLAGPLVVAALAPGIVFSWAWLVAKDSQRLNWREHRRGLRELFGRGGFISSILPKMPDFIRADFHPAQHDTRVLEKMWREKLFGQQGELLQEFRNREALSAA
ncbi:MAG: metal-dependent hydrolase [Moraxellaceae bacterium]|nr:metal-dependent hydrolase [Moraxellaceae bacterium]